MWCRVPRGSPGRAWRSSGTISQWTPQLKDPQWSHTAPGTGCPGKVPLFCWLGFASLVSKQVGSEPPTGNHDKPQCPERDFAHKQVKGCDLPWTPFFWGASGNLPFIPLSHCLQWHLWALHLIPLSFALGTEFCWSFTYFVGSEGIPHDHLPILNESTEKEKLRPSRDVAASLLPSLGKSKLCCSFPLPSLLYPFVSILTTAQWSQWCTKETLLSSTVVSTPSEVYLFLTEMTHVWLKDQFIFQFFSLPS